MSNYSPHLSVAEEHRVARRSLAAQMLGPCTSERYRKLVLLLGVPQLLSHELLRKGRRHQDFSVGKEYHSKVEDSKQKRR